MSKVSRPKKKKSDSSRKSRTSSKRLQFKAHGTSWSMRSSKDKRLLKLPSNLSLGSENDSEIDMKSQMIILNSPKKYKIHVEAPLSRRGSIQHGMDTEWDNLKKAGNNLEFSNIKIDVTMQSEFSKRLVSLKNICTSYKESTYSNHSEADELSPSKIHERNDYETKLLRSNRRMPSISDYRTC